MESLTVGSKDKVSFTVDQGNNAMMYKRIGQSVTLKFKKKKSLQTADFLQENKS